jgi:putative aminopeptidase FrvX
MNTHTKELLDEVLVTHSPCGREAETEDWVLQHFNRLCDEVWRDPHDNIVGKMEGQSSQDAMLLLAHKDEISTMVRNIDDDGKIWLEPLGGTVPWRYGEGPYDILGHEWLTGILSVGSSHSSHRSPRVHKAKVEKPLDWEMCFVDCKLNAEQLAEKGVRVGSLGCVSRLRKQPLYLQDRFVASYALDDKAALVSLVLALEELREAARKPLVDVYVAATSSEEVGISGGAYVTRALTAEHTVNTVIAVDVAPVVEEYPTKLDERPVVLMKDAGFIYHPGLAQELLETCDSLNLGHQETTVRSYGSDTSITVKYGLIGRWACVGMATENTHGYEITSVGAIENVGKLLAGFALGEVRTTTASDPAEGTPAERKGRSRGRRWYAKKKQSAS